MVLAKYLPVILNIREVNTYIYVHPPTQSKDINRKFTKEISVAINDMKHIISLVMKEVKTNNAFHTPN